MPYLIDASSNRSECFSRVDIAFIGQQPVGAVQTVSHFDRILYCWKYFMIILYSSL